MWELSVTKWTPRDPVPYLRALENFAQGVRLIPEQIWDAPDMPSRHFRFGRATDAAVPLVWANSEYVKLHRSVADGRVFDLVEPVHDRYFRHKGERKAIEVWKFPFLLHWTKHDWRHSIGTPSKTTAMGIDYADTAVPNGAVSLQFTFLWVDEDRWEGKDYKVQERICSDEAKSPSVSERIGRRSGLLLPGVGPSLPNHFQRLSLSSALQQMRSWVTGLHLRHATIRI